MLTRSGYGVRRARTAAFAQNPRGPPGGGEHWPLAPDVAYGDGMTIQAGCRVEIRDERSGRRDAFTLVEAAHAKPAESLLSVGSPVAVALLGAHPGDVVAVSTPSGTRRVRVLAVTGP